MPEWTLTPYEQAKVESGEWYLGSVCRRGGHTPPLRYASNRGCAQCQREASGLRLARARPGDENVVQQALEWGWLTFRSEVWACSCGSRRLLVTQPGSRSCVFCNAYEAYLGNRRRRGPPQNKRTPSLYARSDSLALSVRDHVVPSHDHWLIAAQLVDLKGRCFWGCGRWATCLDHYIPVSRWEEWGMRGLDVNDASNLVPSCEMCNRIRTNKLPDETRQYLKEKTEWLSNQSLRSKSSESITSTSTPMQTPSQSSMYGEATQS